MAGKKPLVPSSGSVQPSTGDSLNVIGGNWTPGEWWRPLETDDETGLEIPGCFALEIRGPKFIQQPPYDPHEVSDTICILGFSAHPRHQDNAQLLLAAPDLAEVVRRGLAAGVFVGHLKEAAELAWQKATALAVTVADVPGLSTADQTDEAVTSHQTDPYAPNEESGRNIPTVYDGWFISELEAECRFLQVDIPTEFDREDEVYEENLRDFLQQRVASHQTEVE